MDNQIKDNGAGAIETGVKLPEENRTKRILKMLFVNNMLFRIGALLLSAAVWLLAVGLG